MAHRFWQSNLYPGLEVGFAFCARNWLGGLSRPGGVKVEQATQNRSCAFAGYCGSCAFEWCTAFGSTGNHFSGSKFSLAGRRAVRVSRCDACLETPSLVCNHHHPRDCGRIRLDQIRRLPNSETNSGVRENEGLWDCESRNSQFSNADPECEKNPSVTLQPIAQPAPPPAGFQPIPCSDHPTGSDLAILRNGFSIRHERREVVGSVNSPISVRRQERVRGHSD